MTAAAHTCTVGPTAVTGTRCGKPAVVTFRAATGEVFHECAEHAAPGTVAPEFAVGEFVGVEHIGVAKTGRIVKVGRTRVHVEVVVGRGATERTKVIVRGFGEVRK